MKLLGPFSIDTRSLKPGDVFVALDGARQKGYSFLREAFEKGAAGAICAEIYRKDISPELHEKIQFVTDPREEMAKQAHAHRRSFPIPVIGIAGSVGKTSTKQFLAYLLSRKRNILATEGNLNNQLGLPMMISRLRSEHQAAVFEMGADHIGELAELVQIAEPTLGVLTPIAPEHLQGFGSLSGVYDGELELLRSPYLRTLVTVEGDAELDRRLRAWSGKVVRVGFSDQADVVISDLRVEDGKTFFKIQDRPVILPTTASFLALNAGLAAAAAVQAGVNWMNDPEEWKAEIPKGRFQAKTIADGITVIDDTYNSSPKAFSAAVEAFKKLNFKRKWIVFSDMLELGSESDAWHQALGTEIAGAGVFAAWAFGTHAKRSIEALSEKKTETQGRWFSDVSGLAAELASQVRPGDGILFKGSRGMRVEKVIELLENYLKKEFAAE